MKRLIFSFLLCMTVALCFGQTQTEMNQSAYKDSQKADSALNAVYQKILLEYKDDTAFIKNLKIAENIWIQFRDAEMKMKFPEREHGYYGSMGPMCFAMYYTQLTETRIATLKEWLAGTPEEEGCGGSIKDKDVDTK